MDHKENIHKNDEISSDEQNKKDSSEIKENGGKDEDAKEKNSNIYFITAAISIILLGAGIYALSSGLIKLGGEPQVEKVTYNNFIFEHYSGLWNTQWQNGRQVYNLRLHYNPYQVENISITGDEFWNASNRVYITFDPEDEQLSYVALSASELTLSLMNTFDIKPMAACSKNVTDACASRPIVNCRDYPAGSAVIYIKKDAETSISIDKGCLSIKGTGPELVRASEKVIYRWYGIIGDN